jgi:site-specific DNA-methyltransferase (adenine-specific)
MPEPIQLAQNISLYYADCRETLRQLADNSIDSVVTDPPYALNFMGKGWDNGAIVNDPSFWADVLRVLKPGGHIAVFGELAPIIAWRARSKMRALRYAIA